MILVFKDGRLLKQLPQWPDGDEFSCEIGTYFLDGNGQWFTRLPGWKFPSTVLKGSVPAQYKMIALLFK